MASGATSIPPKLVGKILSLVGDQHSPKINPTTHAFSPTARREEMKLLSACSSTCVYWAQLTRQRMFRHLVLRSYNDLCDLQSLLRIPAASPTRCRIKPIGEVLVLLAVYCTLGDDPWLYDVADLKISGAPRLWRMIIHIHGPPTPTFISASTGQTILHPLFFPAQTVLPTTAFHNFTITTRIEDIHLFDPIVLFNLLQDCLLLRPQEIYCRNLMWDFGSKATPSSVGLTLACDTSFIPVFASGCTDNVLVAAMSRSIPHNEFSQRRQDPHLSFADTSHLVASMNATCEYQPEVFAIDSESDPHDAQAFIDCVGLPIGTHLFLRWEVNDFAFECFVCPPLDDPHSDMRHVVFIAIDLVYHHRTYSKLRESMKAVDWESFLRSVHDFRNPPRIGSKMAHCSEDPRKWLVEFAAHLSGSWIAPGTLLELYAGKEGNSSERTQWVRIELSTPVLYEIKGKREEVEKEATSDSPLGKVE